jgi:glycosyltransferase involved in cell wall biosynthesis
MFRVSVIIPAFNASAYLSDAVRSVRAQTLGDTEIIVVDDGSTDGTAAIAAGLEGVRCFSQENAGPAAAINTGVAAATGAYIAFISADDLWVPHKLEWQFDALASDPSVDLVFGHLQRYGYLPAEAVNEV